MLTAYLPRRVLHVSRLRWRQNGEEGPMRSRGRLLDRSVTGVGWLEGRQDGPSRSKVSAASPQAECPLAGPDLELENASASVAASISSLMSGSGVSILCVLS
jgi:hypothetical protein